MPNVATSAALEINPPSEDLTGVSSANQPRSQINHDRHNRRNRGGSNFVMNRPVRFEGKCSELKGQIYDCTDNTAVQTVLLGQPKKLPNT